jgi:sugar transferase (PEP-CTERM/EpsH1 system associated)
MNESLRNDGRPLVAHVIQRLAIGGLENGLVNLVNYMPENRYRHAIVCLAGSTDYAQRLKVAVPVIVLHQRPGQDFFVHWRLLKLFRRLRPHIVHTRNLSGLEFQIVAAFAGVRGRVHGEHGRDMYDLQGKNLKYNVLRKVIRPFIHRYTAVSIDLAEWLIDTIGITASRVTQIYNGVDDQRCQPCGGNRRRIGPPGFLDENTFVVGTVGRMQAVKDQLTLVRAFLYLIESHQAFRERLRLVIIGNGPLREKSCRLLEEAGAEMLAWLPGERSDIPELMRSFDVFVLPSIAEGISNTILEAMASGLPVVATNVGGNPELVVNGETGILVPPSDPIAMAAAIQSYLTEPAKVQRHGHAGRKRIEENFSIVRMVEGYLSVYDEVLQIATAQTIAGSRRTER